MLAKTLDEYKKYFDKLRFFSKLAAFLLVIFAFFSLYNLGTICNYDEFSRNFCWKLVNEENLLVWIFFQFAILVLFFARFISLLYKSRKSFQFGMVLWLVGFSLTLVYFYLSMPNNSITLGNEEVRYYTVDTRQSIFRHATYSFEIIAFFYMLLSPIKESLTLIFAFLKSK